MDPGGHAGLMCRYQTSMLVLASGISVQLFKEREVNGCE